MARALARISTTDAVPATSAATIQIRTQPTGSAMRGRQKLSAAAMLPMTPLAIVPRPETMVKVPARAMVSRMNCS